MILKKLLSKLVRKILFIWIRLGRVLATAKIEDIIVD